MGKTESREFAREYNRNCGGILKRARLKRNISRQKLGQGIMSEIALGNIDEGDRRHPAAENGSVCRLF